MAPEHDVGAVLGVSVRVRVARGVVGFTNGRMRKQGRFKDSLHMSPKITLGQAREEASEALQVTSTAIRPVSVSKHDVGVAHGKTDRVREATFVMD